MRILRIVVVLILLFGIVFIALRSESLSASAMSVMGFNWMNSYLIPRVLVVLLSVFLLTAVIPLLKFPTKGKVGLSVLVFAVCIGGYLALNPPYINDWIGKGDDVTGTMDGNPIERFLNRDSEFDGLVCLALPDCPYCIRSVPKLELLQKRVPDLGIAVFVFTRDSSGVERFRSHVGETDVPIYLAPEPETTIGLSEGRFPTFLYFKKGKLVHRWSNGQFGYPALDRVESRLQ